MSAPLVTVVVPAFNLVRFLPRALDSALTQQDPGGPIEVIVVDDGSTDETPQILAAYGDRIRSVRQPNRGLVAAVDAGLALARGRYIALLDADDEWPGDRLRRHVRFLDANPTVGLVHGDMEIIDSAGVVIHPSFFAARQITPSDGRVLGRLVGENFISGGASTFRASLLPALCPIAGAAAYPDWWIAACVAAVAEIRCDRGNANRYRQHGANMSLGSGPERQPSIQRHELPWRRWMMSNLVGDPSITVEELRRALANWRFGLLLASSDGPVSSRTLAAADPTAAQARLARLWSPGAAPPRSRELLRALALDPFDGAALIDLELALMREAQEPPAPVDPPLIALETRADVTVAWYEEVIAQPRLLSAYASATEREPDRTLVILTPHGADLDALVRRVERDEFAVRKDCDITVLAPPQTRPAELLLASRASARLTFGPHEGPLGSLPQHEAVSCAASPGAPIAVGARVERSATP